MIILDCSVRTFHCRRNQAEMETTVMGAQSWGEKTDHLGKSWITRS